MMNSHRISLALCCILILTFAGCASRPDEPIEQATIAREQAIEQRAEKFSAADWARAEEVWEEGQALLAQEKYSGLGSVFLRAKSRYDKARDIAQSKRDVLLKQIQEKQEILTAGYDELKARMEKARLSAAKKKELEDCCAELTKTLERLETEITEGEYTLAHGTTGEAEKLMYQAQLKLPEPRR
jgi:hypothetical protein